MTILRVLLICLFSMALAQGLPTAGDIQTTTEVRKLENGKLKEVDLVKKGQVLAYLIQVKAAVNFTGSTMAIRAEVPTGTTLLLDRTRTSKYRFVLEYSADGKNFQKKAMKGWKTVRVVITDPVPQGSTFEVRLFARVN